MNLYKISRNGIAMGYCHADDEDNACWTMMERRNAPLNQKERDLWTAEEISE